MIWSKNRDFYASIKFNNVLKQQRLNVYIIFFIKFTKSYFTPNQVIFISKKNSISKSFFIFEKKKIYFLFSKKLFEIEFFLFLKLLDFE